MFSLFTGTKKVRFADLSAKERETVESVLRGSYPAITSYEIASIIFEVKKVNQDSKYFAGNDITWAFGNHEWTTNVMYNE